MKTALIFPAFITEYTGKELAFLRENGVNLDDYLIKISSEINVDLPDFSYDVDEYRNNELYSQLIAYVFSCAFIDILKQKGIAFQYVAGYSMGIYAALYAAGAYNFETGVNIIHYAFNLVKELSKTGNYGMGAFIGLTVSDLNKLIQENNLNAEIININNQHSIVIAGLKNDIKRLITLAKEEGAMSAGELTVHVPYHSRFLLNYAEQFQNYLDSLEIEDTHVSLISTYDQRSINTKAEIQKELRINLTEKINWYKTMQKLLHENVSLFYEVGAGKDLKKISRFIEGEYKLNTVYKI